MKAEEYLKDFLPDEVYKDYRANVPECREEYLRGFLPRCFSASMDAMTEEALADALDDLAGARSREWCAEDCQLEVPDEAVVRNLAADIARRICRRAYDCWEDAEEELNYELERRCGNAFLVQLGEHEEDYL